MQYSTLSKMATKRHRQWIAIVDNGSIANGDNGAPHRLCRSTMALLNVERFYKSSFKPDDAIVANVAPVEVC